VSHHVIFLVHIPFFSIPSITHNLTTFDLIRTDHFSKDSDSLSSQVPSTSNTPPHVRPIRTNHSTSIDTLLPSTSKATFTSIVPPTSSKIVNLPLSQSIRIHKSTKLPDFAYSSSFNSFLTSIYYLIEPSSYKEAILDSFW